MVSIVFIILFRFFAFFFFLAMPCFVPSVCVCASWVSFGRKMEPSTQSWKLTKVKS